jgi:kynureninase
MIDTKRMMDGMEKARALDASDPMARYRPEFVIQDPDLIYMDGNSLGRLPIQSSMRLREVIDTEWGNGLVRGWNQGWFDAAQRVGEKIDLLLGAAPGQVLVCDSTSVNLFKLVQAALNLQPGRSQIVSDEFNFPSDLYILQGCAAATGKNELVLARSSDGIRIDKEDLYSKITNQTAIVALSHVAFKSGSRYDMAEITQKAHAAGALVLWDLCHSVGALPLELDECEVDLAVGCTYKYLNGGPGSPAFLYVRKSLQDRLRSPIWGWFGQDQPFNFDLQYQPAVGIQRFMAGTPPILALMALEPALDLTINAGIEKLWVKSTALTGFFIDLFDQYLEQLGFILGSPREAEQRGSHISLRHAEGYRICRTLTEEMKVIPDFRQPDNIRLGFAPLYTTYQDVWEAVQRIRQVVDEQRYLHYSTERLTVT